VRTYLSEEPQADWKPRCGHKAHLALQDCAIAWCVTNSTVTESLYVQGPPCPLVMYDPHLFALPNIGIPEE
jgi:hypothetical protein